MQRFLKDFYSQLQKTQSESQFLILVSFLVTFIIVRIITHLQKAGILPNQQGQLHIHHLVPGIIFLLISGYIGLAYWYKPRIRRFMAIVFGIGAALTLDEFALWLYLQDVYWEKQGRDSVDAVIITLILFTIGYLVSSSYGHVWIKKLEHWVKNSSRR